MESWKTAWRVGFAPQLSTPGLQALEKALAADDARLLQGATTSPPPLQCVQDWPVEAACAVGYCFAVDLGGFAPTDGAATVAQIEQAFGEACFKADQNLEQPAGCRFFLNWTDETPREEMCRELLAEVRRELARRDGGAMRLLRKGG